MFDYFRKMKKRQFENDETETNTKTKHDKVFIGILIVFAVIIVVSLVTGVSNVASGSAAEYDFDFKINISDCVILGGLTLAYIITRIRKGRK